MDGWQVAANPALQNFQVGGRQRIKSVLQRARAAAQKIGVQVYLYAF